MSGFCCVIFDAVWRLRKEKAEEEEEQVQRVQEENGELRQMILQLEKVMDGFNKKKWKRSNFT